MKDQTIIDNEAENKDLHNASEEKAENKDLRNASDKKEKKKEKEKVDPKKEFFSWVRIFVVAIALALCINNFLIINANVPSGSMENTIMTGSRMIGLRTAYWFKEPQRGEIIIFKYPDDESENFVKRVIGLPGEKVTIKDSKIYINDSKEPLKETYLKEDWYWENGSEESGGELVYQVPEDSYFVLGDNRNNSNDSRLWTTTNYVSKSKIIAKAEFVYWPWKVKGMLETAKYN